MVDAGPEPTYEEKMRIPPGVSVPDFLGKALATCDFTRGGPDPLSPTPSGSTYVHTCTVIKITLKICSSMKMKYIGWNEQTLSLYLIAALK